MPWPKRDSGSNSAPISSLFSSTINAGSQGFKVHAMSNDAYQLPLYVSFGDEKRRARDVFYG